MTLTKDAGERKERPIARGVLDYFPDALAEVAHVSFVANEQHNPGEPMHWAKEKSTDEADALVRHLLERGTMDTDGLRHSAKVAWRALALLQREIDAEQEAQPGPDFWQRVSVPGQVARREAQEFTLGEEKIDPRRLEAQHDAETLDHCVAGCIPGCPGEEDDIGGVPA